MANEIGNTEANAAITERWRLIALKALFADMVAKNRYLNVTQDIAEHGDIVHVKTNPVPTVGDVTASSGAFTNDQVTLINSDLTVDKGKYVAHDVVDKADIQSDIDLVSNFSQAFMPALGEQIDTDILGLHASMTANAALGNSTSGAVFNDDVILPAILTLDNLKIPMKDRSFLLAPVAIAQLRKDDKWVTADKLGKAAQTNGIMTDLYGNPTFRTPLIATVGQVRKCIYQHKEGAMVAIQRNMKIEKFARTKFSTPFAASVLYGVAVLRNNHNQVLNIKKTLS